MKLFLEILIVVVAVVLLFVGYYVQRGPRK